MIIASTKRLRHEKKNIFFHFCLVLFLLVLWRFFSPLTLFCFVRFDNTAVGEEEQEEEQEEKEEGRRELGGKKRCSKKQYQNWF